MDINYPEWYRVEKEAALTINRLSNLKDISYYLKNTDQYIRRLAILRINQLKPKEAVNFLEQVLNDPLESLLNKKLAAWTLKVIGRKYNLELFIDNPLLNDFSGEESYSDLFEFVITESLPSLDFSKFAVSLLDNLPLEKDYLFRNQEVDFEASFCFKEWLHNWKTIFLKSIKKHLQNFPLLLWKYSKKLSSYLWINIFIKFFDYFKGVILRTYYKNRNSFNPLRLLKQLGFNLAYTLFYPVRLLRKHKKLAFICTAGIYYFLVYTPNGQIFSLKYLNVDLPAWQEQTILATKNILNNLGVIGNTWFSKIKATIAWKILEDYVHTAIQLISGIN